MTNIDEAYSNSLWRTVRPLVLKTIVGAVVAAGLVGVFAVIVGEFNSLHSKAILTIMIVVVFALLAWYDAEISAKRSSAFGLIGLASSVLLLLVGMAKIWISPNDSTYFSFTAFSEWIWIAIVARVALLHAHLLLNIHYKYPTPVLQLVAKATLVLIAVFGFLIVFPAIFTELTLPDEYWRWTWGIAILNITGTVLIPLCSALFGPKSDIAQSHPQRVYNLSPAFDAQGYPIPSPADQWHQARTQQAQAAQMPSAPAQPVAQPTNWHRPPTAPVSTPNPAEGRTAPQQGSVVFAAAPVPSRKLAWPTYTDGTPLPVGADGTPDFSQVERY